MTNKQIIHDVDVSGCEFYNPNIKMDCLLYPLQSDACKNNSNCCYKQRKRLEKLLPDINGKFYKAVDDLKAKEQECEELKSVRDSWMSKFEQETKIRELYQDGLDQLKAENETYKKMLDNSEVRVALTDVRIGEREIWRNLGMKA